MDIEQKQFEEIAAFVRTWTPAKTVSNEDMLTGYSLYKQATIGDCNIPAPSMFSFRVHFFICLSFQEKAKWTAWNALKGISWIDCSSTRYVKRRSYEEVY